MQIIRVIVLEHEAARDGHVGDALDQEGTMVLLHGRCSHRTRARDATICRDGLYVKLSRSAR